MATNSVLGGPDPAPQADAYLQAMQQRLARQGLQQFVQDTVAPLADEIGLAWEQGRLQVFEEHLFTELTERVLRNAISSVPGGHAPRVLLTSLPNEQHAMGLLMVEALLSLEGARCISLGTQMPLLEIVRAAAAHRADIVALSFSAAFPARQVPNLLRQLREALPATTSCGPAAAECGALPRLTACASLPRWTTGSPPLRRGAAHMDKTPRRRTTHRHDVAERSAPRCGLDYIRRLKCGSGPCIRATSIPKASLRCGERHCWPAPCSAETRAAIGVIRSWSVFVPCPRRAPRSVAT